MGVQRNYSTRLTWWTKAIASGLGVGYTPLIPGTVATLEGILLFFLMERMEISFPIRLLFLGLLFILGVRISTIIEQSCGEKDPHLIIIDEIVGTLVVLYFVPISITTLIATFILFRLFDMLKPFPAQTLQEIKGGIGVMMDDVVAGLYTLLILKVALWAGYPYY